MHISMKCLPSKLRVIAVKAPRVLHVGDCGVHTHRCNVQNAPKKVTFYLTLQFQYEREYFMVY